MPAITQNIRDHTNGWSVQEWHNSALVTNAIHLERLLSLCDTIQKEFTARKDPVIGSPWTYACSREEIMQQWSNANADGALYGVPIAVKDNIDVSKVPTSAGCPGFTYTPQENAACVQKLILAGAIIVGKTNLDQFATGLVGTRSPFYGITRNALVPHRISGGSSSGSASVVARGLVPVALGTDTAGSGRVPAALNNIIGLKPTRGRISAYGVVPACKSLDTVSIFALGIHDTTHVLRIMQGFDTKDPFSRSIPADPPIYKVMGTDPVSPNKRLSTIYVPKDPIFVSTPSTPYGNELFMGSWLRTCREMQQFLGADLVHVDMTPMMQLASLLYEGPWVTERWIVLQEYIKNSSSAKDIDPVVLQIVEKGAQFSAADMWKAEYQARALRRTIENLIPPGSILMVPSTPMPAPTIDDITSHPIDLNTKLGTYTNWVNLADFCGVTVPAGFCHGHSQDSKEPLPFSVTLLAQAWHDELLLKTASDWLSTANLTRPTGALTISAKSNFDIYPPIISSDEWVEVAVVGAHLRGMPLHHQLASANAQFLKVTETSKNYRLYALTGSQPEKPGLVRVDNPSTAGASIVVEIYNIPIQMFGKFVSLVPPPLAIGSLELINGVWVKGFVCEPRAIKDGVDITSYGGWKCALSAENKAKLSQLRMQGPVVIANRGEIALRAIRTLQKLDIMSIALFTEADQYAPHVHHATRSIKIPGGPHAYLDPNIVLRAALLSGGIAVWPGYGFLSENPVFASMCQDSGLIFIGPTLQQMRIFGHKHTARDMASKVNVPMVPSSDGIVINSQNAREAAKKLGYPVMLKCTAGGGGIGLANVLTEDLMESAFDSVTRAGKQHFDNDQVFLEKCVVKARHIEVQVVGDGRGLVCILGERDCSLQRRHQKVLEEAPAPNLPSDIKAKVAQYARQLMASVKYRGVGTVEFIYDTIDQQVYFMEVNARLQVEHPVTENIAGIDLVEWMLMIASDYDMQDLFSRTEDRLKLNHKSDNSGSSIEARVYAEDPSNGFRPCTGTISRAVFPTERDVPGVRIDTWVKDGTIITPYYDPLVAKIIVHGRDRVEAADRLVLALKCTHIEGIVTNLPYLHKVTTSTMFNDSKISFTTKSLDSFEFIPPVMTVILAGSGTTIQDYPGRVTYWSVGIPPSGPMDALSFRLANRIVGNHECAAALECTLKGPTLRFNVDLVIAITGAELLSAKLDNENVPQWSPINIRAGQTLSLGMVKEGCRFYVAIRGGIRVPKVLGSRSTMALGGTGGHHGRALRVGDQVFLAESDDQSEVLRDPKEFPKCLIPRFTPIDSSGCWILSALLGPHAAPDYITTQGMNAFLAATWRVDHNANRLGIRLVGPKPEFARQTGGKAGLHPSNVHDCPYAIGSVNLTGDTPTILSQDGPSLGGFVCPLTICQAELWKVAQLRPGDMIRFKVIGWDEAVRQQEANETLVRDFSSNDTSHKENSGAYCNDIQAVLVKINRANEGDSQPEIVYRQAGDCAILIEYGDEDNALDLYLRFRVHAMMHELTKQNLHVTVDGPVTELVPGVRSLQIQYQPRVISQGKLVHKLIDLEKLITSIANASADHWKVPSRILHLPLAFDDDSARSSVSRYMETVRKRAPWLPDNIEFLRRINGLESRENVRDVLSRATYLVLGLGDVYFGAPCAVPLDPRDRIVSSKYNPARTFTSEGVVGIGGVYMCIYGINSPGGYQLIGRTLPVWSHINAAIYEKKTHTVPWLLTYFDQVKYYLVPEEELEHLRSEYNAGLWSPRIETTTFDYVEHLRMLQTHTDEITSIETGRADAFEKEMLAWKSKHLDDESSNAKPPGSPKSPTSSYPAHYERIVAGFAARIWKIAVKEGDEVEAEQVLMVVEAMKAELMVVSPRKGIVRGIMSEVGELIEPNEVVVVIE